MTLVGVNLLLYAIDTTSPHHAPAKTWWDGQLADGTPLGLAWVTVLAFLRLSTNPKVFRNPCTVAQSLELVESWLARPSVSLVAESANHWPRLRSLLLARGTGGNLTTDAHLAAIALEYDAVFCSADADFRRFPGVKWRNPLTAAGAAS